MVCFPTSGECLVPNFDPDHSPALLAFEWFLRVMSQVSVMFADMTAENVLELANDIGVVLFGLVFVGVVLGVWVAIVRAAGPVPKTRPYVKYSDFPYYPYDATGRMVESVEAQNERIRRHNERVIDEWARR